MINMINDQVEAAQAEKRKTIKRNAKRMVWVTFQREGMHRYPAAHTDPRLEEVYYLGYDHRHIFHFKIGLQVYHNDREVEFIIFKHFCEELYDSYVLHLDNKSCEMICDDVYDRIARKYPDRDVVISVSEDNENGAEIYYNSTT